MARTLLASFMVEPGELMNVAVNDTSLIIYFDSNPSIHMPPVEARRLADEILAKLGDSHKCEKCPNPAVDERGGFALCADCAAVWDENDQPKAGESRECAREAGE